MTKFTIAGAGMAGLLAGAILRNEALAIVERQPALPNNHKALLRFRSSIVSDTVGIPFRKVQVIKEVEQSVSAIGANLAYSKKVTGKLGHRSILNTRGGLEVVERYVAPDTFVEELSKKVMAPIHYDRLMNFKTGEPVISTIPMPELMKALSYPGPWPSFSWVPGLTITARLVDCEAYVTRYAVDPEWKFYRVSITGDKLIVEYAFPDTVPQTMDLEASPELGNGAIVDALSFLGVKARFTNTQAKSSRYQKILPVDDNARKRFIIWATDQYNIYSLGRYATWRPGLLMDDIVNDVAIIKRLASGTSEQYNQRNK